MTPYYQHGGITIYHGDCREAEVPAYQVAIADPPYDETSLEWDRWPDGWPRAVLPSHAASLWCFGSQRMFLERCAEFSEWKFAQDVVWEKQNGTGFTADRFRRVHEIALQFYVGQWSDLPHNTPRIPRTGPPKTVTSRGATPHRGVIGVGSYEDDGLRLQPSVVRMRNRQGMALHPTEKPLELVRMLLTYSGTAEGIVYDPFAGSGTVLVAAKELGRIAIGVEGQERYCEIAAKRLEQEVLDFGGIA